MLKHRISDLLRMSNQAIDWALSQEIKAPEKCVLLILANRANEHFQCWPAHRDIAFQSGYSETTVKTALKKLRSQKLITWKHRPDQRGGLSSNLYLLLCSEKRENRPAPTAGDNPAPGGRCPTPRREVPHPGTVDAPAPRRETPHPSAGADDETSLKPNMKPNGTASDSSILKIGNRVGKIHKLKS